MTSTLSLAGRAPKAVGSFDRTASLEYTLGHEAALRAHFGITRIAELTHLDRIGIPVFSAVVPDSPGSISVYNGKGTTPEAARAGALMEAAERQAAFAAIAAGAGAPTMMPGYDLLNGRPVDVAMSRPMTSNGFAGGNNVTEAVYHALCELIERHVLSVVHAVAHERPLALMAQFAGARIEVPGFIDDGVASEYTVPTGSRRVDGLLEQIAAAGYLACLRAAELSPFPVVFIATIGDASNGASRSHTGYGCSLSPEHAAIRALTEAAQGRLCDIQGAREDLLGVDEGDAGNQRRRRQTRLPAGSWYFDAPARAASFAELPDRSSSDIATDVDTLLAVLHSAGCAQASVVDLSPPALPIAVVRAVVPGLETAIVDGAIGPLIAGILDVTRDPEPTIRIIR